MQNSDRNDGHLSTGSQRGDCPSGLREERPQDWLTAEVGLRAYVMDNVNKNPSLACKRCVGVAPGCCYYFVTITNYECITLASAYTHLVNARWGLILERAAVESLIAGKDDSADNLARMLHSEPEKAYSRRRLPCVFLSDEGRCRVYDARPYNCTTHACASTPSDCSPDHTGSFPAPDMRQTTAQLMEHAALQAKENGLVELSAGLCRGIVRAVRELVASGHLEASDWPGIDDVRIGAGLRND